MRVAVYGSGGHGKVVADIVGAMKGHEVVAYLDDDAAKDQQRIGALEVRATRDRLVELAAELKIKGVALGIGDNTDRARVAERIRSANLTVMKAIHPRAVVAPSVTIAEGVVIMAGAVVNPYTRLEEGVCVNTSASVDHDCLVHRYAHIWPGAHVAGSVDIGEFSYIGMGASVLQNLRIGKNVTVGAGAVVVRNLADGITAVGVPARNIKV